MELIYQLSFKGLSPGGGGFRKVLYIKDIAQATLILLGGTDDPFLNALRLPNPDSPFPSLDVAAGGASRFRDSQTGIPYGSLSHISV